MAGIMAIKKTGTILGILIPIDDHSNRVDFEVEEDGITVKTTVNPLVKPAWMEAIYRSQLRTFTIWDMVKAIEKDETGNYPATYISDIKVLEELEYPLISTNGGGGDRGWLGEGIFKIILP